MSSARRAIAENDRQDEQWRKLVVALGAMYEEVGRTYFLSNHILGKLRRSYIPVAVKKGHSIQLRWNEFNKLVIRRVGQLPLSDADIVALTDEAAKRLVERLQTLRCQRRSR